MPEMTPPAGNPAQPPPTAPPGTGQPAIGSSPATGPTQNAGHAAAGIQVLSVVAKGLERAIPMLGAATEPGQAALKALQLIAKHLQPGSVSPAGEQNQMKAMMMRQQQLGPQMAAMRAQQGGAPPGAAAPPPQAAA